MILFFKRILITLVAIATTISASLGNYIDSKRPHENNFRVTSYIVADAIQDPASLHAEDFDIITDTFLFGCATFDRNGNVTVNDKVLSTAIKNLRDVIGGRNVTIALTILGPSYTSEAPSWEDQMKEQGREHTHAFKSGKLEDNIVAVLNKYDLDGVEFDYEYPLSIVNWKYFNDFLVSMDSKLGNKTLGIAISDWDMKLDTKAINAVDHFEFMLYDVYDEIGRHSTFETSKKLSNKVSLMGIPKSKVDFGLPFYARPTDHEAFWYEYKSYSDKLDEKNYYHDDRINKDFWFNTPEIIEEKTTFAITKGFGGVMVWHYNCDLPSSNEKSLFRAIKKAVDNFDQ